MKLPIIISGGNGQAYDYIEIEGDKLPVDLPEIKIRMHNEQIAAQLITAWGANNCENVAFSVGNIYEKYVELLDKLNKGE